MKDNHKSGDVGSTVVITVVAEGEPVPTGQWFRSGDGEGDKTDRPIYSEPGRFEMKLDQQDYLRLNYSLTIHDLSHADHQVEFYLRLSNPLGSVNTPKTEILVNHLICQTRKLQEITINVGEPVQLTCPTPVSVHPSKRDRWIYDESSR